MASIRREDRPSKPWRLDWRERGRQRTKRFATKAEARAFRSRIESGERIGDTSRLTVEDWLAEWFETSQINWAVVTRAERADRIDNLIVPYLGKQRLTELTRRDVRQWRSALVREKRATAYQAQRAGQVLSAALGVAVRDDLIRTNPCRELGPIYQSVVRRQPAQPIEVELIRAQMAYPRDRVMVSLMAYAGLRPNEMRALRWEDVSDHSVHVRSAIGADGREKRTKSKERPVPIIAPLADDLAALHEGDDRPAEGIVAPFHTDHRNWTTRVWRPARKRAGLEKVPPYALRHTFASLLIAEGRNAWQVAMLMGNTPEMVLRVYGHLFTDAELSAARPMEEVAVEARHAASSSTIDANRPRGARGLGGGTDTGR